jgi:cell division protein FtsL
MLKFFNFCLVAGVLASGFILYNLEHQTRQAERDISRLNAAIKDEQESIKLLEAEWSNLTRPERLQKLAEEHLQMKPVSQLQLIEESELAVRVPAEPIVKLEEEGKDPIGDILKAME